MAETDCITSEKLLDICRRDSKALIPNYNSKLPNSPDFVGEDRKVEVCKVCLKTTRKAWQEAYPQIVLMIMGRAVIEKANRIQEIIWEPIGKWKDYAQIKMVIECGA